METVSRSLMEMVNTLKRLLLSLCVFLCSSPVFAAVKLYTQTTQPAVCITGDLWVDTDGSPGDRFYTCTAANIWTRNIGSGGDNLGSATYGTVTALWASGACSGYLKSDGTCDTPSGSATYPSAAGVAVWGGSAWGTSITLGTGVQTALGNAVDGTGGLASKAALDLKANSSGISFVAGTLDDMKIITTAQPTNGENLIDDTVAYGATEDNLRLWSIDKIGLELAGKEPADATILKDADIGSTVQAYDAYLDDDAIEFVIDGGGSAITTGVKGFLEIPYNATINRVTTVCDQSGSIVVDVWKDTYANYPPTVADTITASAKPTISSATKYQDSTLTGWTTSLSAGDFIGFNVDSASTVTKCTISLKVTK